MQAPPARANVTSAAFWDLADRWKIPDLAALELIGHAGGLSKKGTRPRFRLNERETAITRFLVEIDQSLHDLGLDASTWVNGAIQPAPFKGATLIEYLTQNGLQGAQDASRYILKNGLKLSMSRR